MNWELREQVHFSGPYRIIHGVRGYSVWHYEKTSSCIRREIRTLDEAKLTARNHAATQDLWA